MKLAYVISTQPTAFQAVVYSPDFEAHASRLAALGYDGIELAIREPLRLDLPAVARVVEKYKLSVPAIGTGQAWGEEHLSFTDPDPDVREKAIERILSHFRVAKRFNALVIIGLIRGTVQPGVAHEQAMDWLASALTRLAGQAAERDVRLAVEPINRYETTLLNTVAETNAIIDSVGANNIGILFDTFHANIEEPSITASLRACGTRLFHIHLADSNRWAPGAGHTDFAAVLGTLREMNYPGWVSTEILPRPDIERAQSMTIKTIKPLL